MKNITKGKIMNNFKKIGLSALAGSLAMVSANAVEYTMSGEIASSFQTAKGATSTEANNGKGFGTETDLTFTAAGELDNGFTVDMLMGVNTAAALSNSSSQVTLGMGSLGAVRLNHNGGSSANAIDDVMPNAYQETWDGLSDGSNPSFFGDMNSSGSIEYRTPAVEYSGVTISGSVLYDPNSASQSTTASPSGGANGVRGIGATSITGQSATIKLTHASGLEIGGGIEDAADDAGMTGVMGNTSQQTGGSPMAEVEYGGIKVGGSKLLLIIPLLSMLGGGAWAGFELYNEFRVLKATVMKYQPPDITGIEQEIAVIKETLVSVGESVELAKDYTRTIKNDLKDDLARQETLMDRLENKVNASQDEIDKTIDVAGERFDARRDALYSDTDRKIKELEDRLGAKLQRALDNPLAN